VIGGIHNDAHAGKTSPSAAVAANTPRLMARATVAPASA
jgi:hypothetical protein